METYFEGMPSKYKPAMYKNRREGQEWKCFDCGKVSQKHHMREHIEVHVSGLQYACPDCKATFTSKNNMRTHMIKSCTLKTWTKCHWNKCHFKSDIQESLDNHIYLKHTKILQNKIGQVTGSQNNSMFIQPLQLNKYTKANQNDQSLLSSFKCRFCDFLTYDKAQLANHIVIKHPAAIKIFPQDFQ